MSYQNLILEQATLSPYKKDTVVDKKEGQEMILKLKVFAIKA